MWLLLGPTSAYRTYVVLYDLCEVMIIADTQDACLANEECINCILIIVTFMKSFHNYNHDNKGLWVSNKENNSLCLLNSVCNDL